MKILIAEDDGLSRQILQRILVRYGTCDAVVDGVEAVEAFDLAWSDKAPYDLICLDIMMPNMDGQEALKRIRRKEKQMGLAGAREVKVIMLTALDDPDSVIEAFYCGGATAYMVKPVEMEELQLQLRNLSLIGTGADRRPGACEG